VDLDYFGVIYSSSGYFFYHVKVLLDTGFCIFCCGSGSSAAFSDAVLFRKCKSESRLLPASKIYFETMCQYPGLHFRLSY
jgi:hypothetical protein